MRLILSIFLTFGLTSAAFAAKPQRLLTFGELMRLTPQKRIHYVHDIARLLIILERQQAKFAVADVGRRDELKFQIAWLTRSLAALPEAEAAETAVPAWQDGKWSCGGDPQTVAFNPKTGTCAYLNKGGFDWADRGACPAESHIYFHRAELGCIPNSNWDRLGIDRKGRLNAGSELPADAFSGKGEAETRKFVFGTLEVPGGQGLVAEVSKDQNCATLSSQQREKLMSEFRAKAGSGAECLRGGFFSKFANGMKTCAKSDNPLNAQCPANKEACNPAVFCYGFAYDRKLELDPSKGDIPKERQGYASGTICATPDQNFTQNCEAVLQTQLNKPLNFSLDELNRRLGSTPEGRQYAQNLFDKLKDIPAKACDPASIPFIHGKYADLIKSTQDDYNRLCASADFKALFCQECANIATHIAQMNYDATGKTKLADVSPVDAPESSDTIK